MNFQDQWRGGGTGKGAYILQAASASQKPLIVKGASGQTANIFEVQNSAGTSLFSVDVNGNVTYIGDETISDALTVTGAIVGNSTLSISGATSLASLTASSLSVSGATTLTGDVMANHNLTVNNNLIVNNFEYQNKGIYLGEQTVAPSGVADKGVLYASEVSTITELFHKNNAGTAVQITSGGTLGTAAAVTGFTPAGGSLTLAGADAITLTSTDTTNVTLPTSGTLVNTAVTTLSSLVSIGTITTGVWNGTDIALADGGTGASLVDPNADRIFFWDDSETSTAFLSLGNGLTITTTSIAVDSASDTVDGIVELATGAETTTGTDATRAVTPDGLAGSDFGKKVIQMKVVDDATALTTGDGKLYFVIPPELNGYNLVDADAMVSTVSTSGTPTYQINNVTQAADMLTVRITIDANENTSYTAATGVTIDTNNDDVATGDILRIDKDVAGTGEKGDTIVLTFQLP